ncbi:PucR family transcriptional regulator [Nakamurella lactea]|uniref:PucR family transcriptional regulator n=1 Tax=Nakamurella lactea TaxID=459515 RepID=UPI00042350F9|nr:helix-turn-helix domain-containing protein [Nakamurella lactea]
MAPTGHPLTGLARVLSDLGGTFLDLLHGDIERTGHVGGVHIYDLAHPLEPAFAAVVLGVGVHDEQQAADLVAELADTAAVALVVPLPLTIGPQLREQLDRAGLVLFGLRQGASWVQLAAVMGTVLAEFDVGEVEPASLGGPPSGDLFAVANAVAALIDAPITIEDRHSRVLAFSGRQDEADPARVATIIGRQVPAENIAQLRSRGVFDRLQNGTDPVHVDALVLRSGEFSMPRVAVPVWAGTEYLGSMWAAVPAPLGEQRLAAFADSAKLVALHLLRVRAGADVSRRLQTDLVSTALEGGPRSGDAIARLGLAGRSSVVMALSLVASPGLAGAADQAARREHLSDALAMHLSAFHRTSAVATIGSVVYAVLPVFGDPAGQATRTARAFLDRSNSPAVIGIGSLSLDAAGLAQSRIDADRALRVLAARGRSGRLATIDDVHFDALLLEFDDLVSGRGGLPVGSVARLLEHDTQHQTQFINTLHHWLEAFGDVSLAASRAIVHPNTFRYRLRRLAEVGDIDLDDPTDRFAALLQLRLMSLRDQPGDRPAAVIPMFGQQNRPPTADQAPPRQEP